MEMRALFLSRTAAYLAAERMAHRYGYSESEANLKCRVYPYYKRGELRGWEAWYPKGRGNSCVLESEVSYA